MNKRRLIPLALALLVLFTLFLIFFTRNTFVSSDPVNNTSQNLNSLNWIGTNNLNNLAYDSVNNITYFSSGSAGIIGDYNRTSNSVDDLRITNNSNWSSGLGFKSLAYDATDKLVYYSFANGLGDYNRTSNATENLTTVVSPWVGLGAIVSMTYDFNKSIFLGGTPGVFGVYNRTTGTSTNLAGTGSWFGVVNYIDAMTFDSSRNLTYFAGLNGLFGYYNLSSNTMTSLNASVNWTGNNPLYALTYDSVNKLVYFGGGSGLFGYYNASSNTSTSLNATVVNVIGTNSISFLTYDSINKLVYFGGSGGVLGYYNFTSNIVTDARGNDSWIGTTTLNSLSYGLQDNLIYFVGQQGFFGDYNRTLGLTENLRPSATNNWIGTTNLAGLAYDTATNLVYLGGEGGAFGAYNISSNFVSNLKTVDINNFMGYNSFITLTSDPNRGLIYFGGSNITAGGSVPATFGVYTEATNSSENLGGTGTALTTWNSISLNYILYSPIDDLVYIIGGTSGGFGVYSRALNITEDLRAVTSPWTGFISLTSLAYDTTYNLVYIGGNNGKFGYYNWATNTSGSLTATGPIGTSQITALTYDPNNKLAYLGGYNPGFFGVYNRATNVTQNLTGTASWISPNAIRSLTYSTQNNLIYMVGDNGIFGDYNITSNVTEDLRPTALWMFTQNTSAFSLRRVTYDSTDNLIYLIGDYGIFGIYNRTANATLQAVVAAIPAPQINNILQQGYNSYTANTSTKGGITTASVSIPNINAGTPFNVNINTGGSIGVNQLTITTNKSISMGNLSIAPASNPSKADLRVSVNGTVYQSFNISTTGLNDSNIANVLIRFYVNISWFTTNHVDPLSLRLYRNTNTTQTANWTALPTALIAEDSQYYYFLAISPGFSAYSVFAAELICNDGTVRCFLNDSQICTSEVWVVSKNCQLGCNKDNGRCITTSDEAVTSFQNAFNAVGVFVSNNFNVGGVAYFFVFIIVISGIIVGYISLINAIRKKRR